MLMGLQPITWDLHVINFNPYDSTNVWPENWPFIDPAIQANEVRLLMKGIY